MDWPLVVARFVHFAATMTLFGAASFTAALAPASLAGDFAPLLRRIGAPLALLSLASALAWLILVAREMAGGDLDLAGLSAVLTDTAFGAVWRARLALLALLVFAALRPDPRWRFPALVAGLATASLGLVGHAAMQEGPLGVAHRLNDAVHLLATAGWLGGLPMFLASLALFANGRRDALAAMRRFSRAGQYVVAAVFATGALNIALTSGAPPWPPDSGYRAGLLAKILAVGAMTALALVNRYALAPRIERSPRAAHAMAAAAAAEVALALVAVALVSGFATLAPR